MHGKTTIKIIALCCSSEIIGFGFCFLGSIVWLLDHVGLLEVEGWGQGTLSL
jgi:hypothetical protein